MLARTEPPGKQCTKSWNLSPDVCRDTTLPFEATNTTRRPSGRGRQNQPSDVFVPFRFANVTKPVVGTELAGPSFCSLPRVVEGALLLSLRFGELLIFHYLWFGSSG